CVFAEPVPLTAWTAPFRSGLYAILVPDPGATPRPFRPIYFGESEDISDQSFINKHPKYPCWINEAGDVSKLYIAVYHMPFSTREQRLAVESSLISEYRPVCNLSDFLESGQEK
ncbi:MAG: hypothetical protein AB1715_11720, partial [Acidobacteriota bacterium]